MCEKIYIESWEKDFLSNRLVSCKKHVKTDIDNIVCVSRWVMSMKAIDVVVFWWWEVMTDARPFPYNGWNYVLWFFPTIYKKNYIICWWIGDPKNMFSPILHKIFLWRAKQIILREETSHQRALVFNSESILHHDFCYSVLAWITPLCVQDKPYILINANTYLWNSDVVEKIKEAVVEHPTCDVFFFPAAWGSDDKLFSELEIIVPWITLLDRRDMSLDESVWWIAGADHVCAARLHVLLVAQYFGVLFSPFVYQEKIEKCVLRAEHAELVSK